jgi:arylsulfatase A-like enzyme
MKLFRVLILAILINLGCGCYKSEKVKQKPNVLFILVDDLGLKDLGCSGSDFYETPNIDKLHDKSVVFTNGYAAAPVCSPSRASIMSGQFTARHGITDYLGAKFGETWRENGRHTKLLPAGYQPELKSELTTLPEALKQNGYKTFLAGKWHLGDIGSYPEDHGFDYNIGGFFSGMVRSFFSPYYIPTLEDGPEGENLQMRLASEVENFIDNNKDSTFFAFLSFYAVHCPIQTSKEKWEKYSNKAAGMDLPEKGFKMEKRMPIRRIQDNPNYAGLVESMDDAVGIVLKCLEDNGIADNTIVIFTSDNGGVSSGDDYATSNLPYRGGKGYQWEAGIREPYFIYVPWLDNDVKSCNTPVTGTDFYPTILDLIGVNLLPEEHVDGVSLVPLLKGNEIAERPLYWHYPHYGNQGGDPSSIR